MKKVGFLTSAIFSVMIMPAFADIANNAESATCNSDTIGVSDGSTILEAQWAAQSIECLAGTYLDATTATCVACPVGSYCAGDTYTYNGSDMGVSGACESGYTTDGSAATQGDCYRECETTDVAHATAVSGKYYYGDNNQCLATACADGWNAQSGACVANIIQITYKLENGAEDIEGSCTYNEIFNLPTAPTKTGYDFSGWTVIIPEEPGFDWSVLTIGTEGSSQSYKSNNGQGGNGSNQNNLEPGHWEAGFSYGTVHGTSYCSALSGDNNGQSFNNSSSNWTASLADVTESSGGNCWCQIEGFTPSGESEKQEVSSRIVFYRDTGSSNNCGWDCARDCSDRIRYSQSLRTALYASE